MHVLDKPITSFTTNGIDKSLQQCRPLYCPIGGVFFGLRMAALDREEDCPGETAHTLAREETIQWGGECRMQRRIRVGRYARYLGFEEDRRSSSRERFGDFMATARQGAGGVASIFYCFGELSDCRLAGCFFCILLHRLEIVVQIGSFLHSFVIIFLKISFCQLFFGPFWQPP